MSKEAMKLALEALERTLEMLEQADCSTGYCCCGSLMDGHGIGDGHGPVDGGDYYQSKAIQAARHAITALREARAEEPAQQEPAFWLNEQGQLSATRGFAERHSIGQKIIPLYTSPPAQQEPVATDWERIARVQDAKLRAMCNESGGFEKLCEVMDRYEHTSPQPAQQEPVAVWELFEDGWDSIADPEWMETLPVGTKLYTSPPAQRTWVGLTDEDVRQCSRDVVAGGSENSVDRFAYAIEAKLKEKNNG